MTTPTEAHGWEGPNRRLHTRDTDNWPLDLFVKANDPVLEEPGVHETAGVVRSHRLGLIGYTLNKSLKMTDWKIRQEMAKGMDQETEAALQKREIYDSGLSVDDALEYLKEFS